MKKTPKNEINGYTDTEVKTILNFGVAQKANTIYLKTGFDYFSFE